MTIQAVEINADDFEREYNPTQRDWHTDIPVGTPLEHIWTIVEGDFGNLYAVAGYAFVNRLMYCTTEKPWTDEFMVAEWMIYEEQDEDLR